jgi:ABC-2 type transport system permease protein
MRNVWTIGTREFKSYLASPMAYIIATFFLVGTGAFFVLFTSTWHDETSLRGVLGSQFYIAIILMFMAILTMRLISEEKKLGTIELLMTAPLRDSELVVGKYLGSVLVMLAMFAFTLYFPILLLIYGDPDLGPVFSGYLGLVLLGSSALAVGIFASSVTANQILSAVLGGGILLGLWFLGSAASLLPVGIGAVVAYFSLANYLPDFVRGIIDLRGVVYYLSITALFLFMAVRSLENSRWN